MMRERLDCAVLLTRCTHDWVAPYIGCHAGGRLHVHSLDAQVDIDSEGASAVLAGESMALRRFDVCIMPVAPSTLSWARISLAQAIPRLQTPVIAYVKDLTAAGLYDLYELGVADFLRDPFCPHELRIRLERLLDDQRRTPLPAARGNLADGGGGAAQYAGAPTVGDHVCEDIRDHGGYELEVYAAAAASRSATARESFRDAKSHIIARFERAYLKAALGKHGGNIAMAARAAQKHRRAFWALMRKHDIDAAPFRELAGVPGSAAGSVAGAKAALAGSAKPDVAAAAATGHTTEAQAERRPVYPGLIHYARTGVVLRNNASAPARPGALPDVGG